MPKRIPTPPPPDNEPRYLTIAHPYPAQGKMELDADRKELAFWLACCIGKDNLYAIHHKPTAGNMVIVEVDRELPDFTIVLGLHKWKEFLKEPVDMEVTCESKVFFCQLSDGRKVQKNGWKRVAVEESWFHDWSPDNPYIVYPYPKTHYCEQPPEDRTTYRLCRPLPAASFPPPLPERLPPVGSPEWLKYKATRGVQPDPKKWGKNMPAAAGSNSGIASNGTNPRGPIIHGPRPVRPAATWNNSSTFPSGSRDAASANPVPVQEENWGPGWASATSKPVLADPPGLTPPGLTVSPAGSSTDEENFFPRLDPKTGTVVVGGSNVVDDEDDDDDDEFDVPRGVPTIVTIAPTDDTQTEEENLWEGFDVPKKNSQSAEEIICPTHGVVCRRGICTDYSRLKKQKEKERQLKERERERDQAQDNWRNKTGKGRGKGRGDPGSGTNTPREKPAHLAPRPKPAHLLPREKPAHLQSSASQSSAQPSSSSDSSASASPVPAPAMKKANSDTTSVSGWGKVSNDPWGGGKSAASRAPDARSVAASSASGWGRTSNSPWDETDRPPTPKVEASVRPPVNAKQDNRAPDVPRGNAGAVKGKVKPSWADMMDEEDDMESIAGTVRTWDDVSEGPW